MTTEISPFLYWKHHFFFFFERYWKHHFLYLMNEIENFYYCSTRQQSHFSVYFNKVVRSTEVKRLRLCLFWVKMTSENAFSEMRLFGWFGKFYFSEIEIRWPKKNAFDHGNHFTLLFSLQSISEKWERERERARTREEASNAISPSRDHAVDRDLAFARSH